MDLQYFDCYRLTMALMLPLFSVSTISKNKPAKSIILNTLDTLCTSNVQLQALCTGIEESKKLCSSMTTRSYMHVVVCPVKMTKSVFIAALMCST